MALDPGTKLGSHEILAPLGVGGMGEVYRARDSRLGREVAIKILPAAFSGDAARLARLAREARLLAVLNHPNIATIFGLEEQLGVCALVMELIEGPTLAERIADGPFELEVALETARQISEALEAAHEKGIVHRDLKPANIKFTATGVVKVLDFGLAGVINESSDQDFVPTISLGVSREGMIAGTPAYMSPEQTRGDRADNRADVWAFGCVLYEMLTGQSAFGRATVSQTLAATLEREPEWTRLPPTVPEGVRRLLRRCLEKDVRRRLHNIADARIEIEDALAESSGSAASVAAPATSARRPNLWIALTVFLLLATLISGTWAILQWVRDETPPTAFVVLPPGNGAFESGIGGADNWPFPVFSPDGRHLAFTARDSSRRVMIWLRSMDSVTPRAIPGTEGAGAPFWSPDSGSIAFFARGKLRRVDVTGGPVRELCDAEVTARGGTWSRGGTILFAPQPSGPLYRVSSAGGECKPATELATGQNSHRAPEFLPDGNRFLYYAVGQPDVSGVYWGTLDSKDSGRLPITTDSGAVYSSSGNLLFTRQGVLFFQRFDAGTLEIFGEPTPVTDGIAYFANFKAFSVSEKGDLAYWQDPEIQAQLTWLDRGGNVIKTVGEPGNYQGIDVSRDGKILVHRHDGNGGDILLLESSGGSPRRLTFDASQHNSSPIWSADGLRFAFQSFRNGKWGIYQGHVNGSVGEGPLWESVVSTTPLAWSPNGMSIIFWTLEKGTSLWAAPMSQGQKPTFVAGTASAAQFSHDGKWLAYGSTETGGSEVYIRPAESPEPRRPVSPNGGILPRWRTDGKETELFYVSTIDRKLISVKIRVAGSSVRFESPTVLFDMGTAASTGHSGGPFHFYAVSPDGQQFLVPRAVSPDVFRPSPITVIRDWNPSRDP